MQQHNLAPRDPRPLSLGDGHDAAEVWQAPETLVAQSETAPYPIGALRDPIRFAVEEVQSFVRAPIEMVSASALTTLSIAGQRLADVRREDTLCGPVS